MEKLPAPQIEEERRKNSGTQKHGNLRRKEKGRRQWHGRHVERKGREEKEGGRRTWEGDWKEGRAGLEENRRNEEEAVRHISVSWLFLKGRGSGLCQRQACLWRRYEEKL